MDGGPADARAEDPPRPVGLIAVDDQTRVRWNRARTAQDAERLKRLPKADAKTTEAATQARQQGTVNHSGRG